MNAPLDGLTAATGALEAVDQQLTELTGRFLGKISSQQTDILLVAATTKQQLASISLTNASLAEVRAGWDSLEQSDAVTTFDGEVATALDQDSQALGTGGSFPDLERFSPSEGRPGLRGRICDITKANSSMDGRQRDP